MNKIIIYLRDLRDFRFFLLADFLLRRAVLDLREDFFFPPVWSGSVLLGSGFPVLLGSGFPVPNKFSKRDDDFGGLSDIIYMKYILFIY
jgi:hypothetical protein